MHPYIKYIKHVQTCIENAEKYHSKISEDILNIHGFSAKTNRHFYNNLLNMPDARYLEIGCWAGSSLCSAMYNNNATITCIDDFSQSLVHKAELLKNIAKYKGSNNVLFIENDCYKVDVSKLNKHNIYLYDGFHDYRSHHNALTHYYECLDDIFIFIVDDWNQAENRSGTKDSISRLKLKVLFEKEIILTDDDSHTQPPLRDTSWWNGVYIAVLLKTV